MLRGERRSFFCPNKLWHEIKKETKECISISQYIRMAIIEKMKKDNPEFKDEYIKLIK